MYRVFWVSRTAEAACKRFPSDVREALHAMIASLAENPHPEGCLKLTGSGGWRVRVARSYRLVYEIDRAERTVTLLEFGDRKNIY